MSKVFFKKRFMVSYTLLVLSLMCCVNEYNPFNDTANARTYILRTSLNLKTDTIPIFTTDSLELLFTVCNLIQKVSIQVEKNRYFNFKMIDAVCANKIEAVSFYDTGYQEVRIVTYRQNGDSVILKKKYYVKSCFELDSVGGYYGDALHLHAETDNKRLDKDIKYVWKIGSDSTAPSRNSDTVIIVNDTLKNNFGQLFVLDEKFNKVSPAFIYKVNLLDNIPKIVIADGIDSDTLYTGSDSIDLKIRVEKCIDQVSAYVNGQQMDNDIMQNAFIKRIKRTDSQVKKLTIDVSGRVGNQRVVYVEFNSKKQQSIIPELTILEKIINGEVTVFEENHAIEGSVDFSSNRAIHYTVSLFEGNNIFVDSVQSVSEQSFYWRIPVLLKKDKTIFRIELSDQLNVVDDTTLVINYCKDCIDSISPEIASILVNGSAPISNRYVSHKKEVTIALICYDAGDVDSVFINNRLMKHGVGTKLQWSYDTLVNHISNPDTFYFYAVDKSGNRSVKSTIVAGYNTSPYIETSPDSIEHALAGVLYTSSIDIRDNDVNDIVTYSINKTELKGIFIDEKGTIKWTPEKSDTGFHTVEITGTDRAGYKISFSYVVYVSENALDPVKFVTSRNEFPNLITCTDSISIPLNVSGGTKPFVFEITDRSKDNKKIQVLQSCFKWKPDCSLDTGSHQFFVVVRDTLRLSDTLWPVVTVLPANHEFTLKELRWSGIKKPDSSLDLSRDRTDTLFFAINDPDNPQYERHTIEVTSGSEKYSIMADSGKFFVTLPHTARISGRDSLVLIVKDKGNHTKRVVSKLDYGKSPLTATLLQPRNDSIVESKDIAFRWSCSDPDGEALKYHFTLQFIDGTFQIEKEIQDTFCTVSGLKKAGVYYWSVIASDSKSSTSSLSGKLSCFPLDRVRIDTTVSKLPELIQCSTFVKAPIVIKNGYPPFTYKCSQPMVISGDSLAWIADCNKTGSYKINLEVQDSVGNTDSYTFNTSVYGSDSLGLMIVNNIPRNENNEIDISKSMGKTVVCTLGIIDPDPSPPEKFIVEVFLGNIQQQYFNNYVSRTFFVSLKPDMSKVYDTLRVNVQDVDNHKKTLTEVIYYGINQNLLR